MTSSPQQLPDDTHAQIEALCAAGDALADEGDLSAALGKYWAAWDLLPTPQSQWTAATWILSAIGDANFAGGDFVAGRDNLTLAMHCPDAVGNPFLHLRLGQCRLELGDSLRASDDLARAYLLDVQVFEGEDPKYLAFIESQLRSA